MKSASQKAVRQAVILAAGMGARIRGHIPETPKGFIELGGGPIIERSIRLLLDAGIEDIVIATGYLADQYERLTDRFGAIRTVLNEEYATTGSMVSLYLARELARPPFLLLESDLIYERAALPSLLAETRGHAVLISGRTDSGDEVYVAGRDGLIKDISKDAARIPDPAGELTGLSLISEDLFADMLTCAEELFPNGRQIHYETDVLRRLATQRDVYYRLEPGLVWSEIDDPSHLERAQTRIWPRILERDGGPSS